jgi:hypothetical protein
MAKKGFLLGVVLFVVILPVLASDQSVADKDAQSLLSAFVSYTDLRMRSVQQSLELLAATAEVKSGKWEAMKGLLEVCQKSDGKLIVWYVLPDGTYYTVDKGLMDVKLSDRSYFADLMAGKKITGSLVVSKSTGQRSAVIAVPIEEGGKVVGAIGISLFLDRLSEDIGAALRLRPDVAFFALAPNGQTTLHTKTDRHFLDPRELGSETLKTAVNEMLSKEAGESTYFFDNVTKQVIYRTSPLTQWKVAITFNAAGQK